MRNYQRPVWDPNLPPARVETATLTGDVATKAFAEINKALKPVLERAQEIKDGMTARLYYGPR